MVAVATLGALFGAWRKSGLALVALVVGNGSRTKLIAGVAVRISLLLRPAIECGLDSQSLTLL
jgi:hypothetical protein